MVDGYLLPEKSKTYQILILIFSLSLVEIIF